MPALLRGCRGPNPYRGNGLGESLALGSATPVPAAPALGMGSLVKRQELGSTGAEPIPGDWEGPRHHPLHPLGGGAKTEFLGTAQDKPSAVWEQKGERRPLSHPCQAGELQAKGTMETSHTIAPRDKERPLQYSEGSLG